MVGCDGWLDVAKASGDSPRNKRRDRGLELDWRLAGLAPDPIDPQHEAVGYHSVITETWNSSFTSSRGQQNAAFPIGA